MRCKLTFVDGEVCYVDRASLPALQKFMSITRKWGLSLNGRVIAPDQIKDMTVVEASSATRSAPKRKSSSTQGARRKAKQSDNPQV